MDTSKEEKMAEDLIAYKLQRANILVAKPKFDQEGADLLALLDVGDGARFCRIQCKGRSLTNSPTSNVTVPKRYVSDGFVLFLYVETDRTDETNLFCFFGKEIRDSWAQRGELYVLNLARARFQSDLAKFVFDEVKIRELVKTIINVDVKGEFNRIIHGYGDLALSPLTLRASGIVGPPPTDATDP